MISGPVRINELTSEHKARFWSKVRKGDAASCWEWTGARDSEGYGAFRLRLGLRYGNFRAHRAAFAIEHGDPGDLYVLHRCDNPPCCNPSHLFLGTAADNQHDCIRKGRRAEWIWRGEKHWFAKLSNADVALIRELAASGLPQKEIAARYPVTASTISAIVLRKSRR